MIRYEIQKLFQRSSARLLLVLLFLINGFLLWHQSIPGTERYFDYDTGDILSLYRALPEDPKEALAALEQQQRLLSDALNYGTDPGMLLTGDLYTERRLFDQVIQRVEPVAEYDTILREIQDNGETLLLSGRYAEDTFGYRNVLKSRDAYRMLAHMQPGLCYSGAIEMLPGGRTTDLVLVVLCLLTGLELICTERISGTLALSKPAYRGSSALFLAKILAGTLVALFSVLLFYGSNLVIGLIRCGPIPMNEPIQSVFGFVRSPWNITVGAYLFGFFALKGLWAASIMAIVYLSCWLGRSAAECWGWVLGFIGLSILYQDAPLSPVFTGNTAVLFGEYRNLNVWGWPVTINFASVSVMSITIVLGFSLAMILHIKLPPTVQSRQRHPSHRFARISMGLTRYEIKKLLMTQGGIWILIGMIVLQIMIYCQFTVNIHPQERLYMQYSQILSGQSSPEKDAYLAQEETRFRKLYAALEESGRSLSNGQLDGDAYEAICAGITRQLENEPIFLRAKDQYEQMKAKGFQYVCLTGYDRLLGKQGMGELLRQTLILAMALIAGLSGIYSVEHETGMVLLQNSSANRATVNRIKGILGQCYGAIGAGIAYLPQLCAVGIGYGLPALTAPAGSVPNLRISFGTVGGALALYGGLLLLATAGAVQIILFLSGKMKTTVQTYLFSSIALLVPIAVLTALVNFVPL